MKYIICTCETIDCARKPFEKLAFIVALFDFILNYSWKCTSPKAAQQRKRYFRSLKALSNILKYVFFFVCWLAFLLCSMINVTITVHRYRNWTLVLRNELSFFPQLPEHPSRFSSDHWYSLETFCQRGQLILLHYTTAYPFRIYIVLHIAT